MLGLCNKAKHKQLFFFNDDYNKCRILTKRMNYYRCIFLIEHIYREDNNIIYRIRIIRATSSYINSDCLHCFETLYIARQLVHVNLEDWNKSKKSILFVSFPTLIKNYHKLMRKKYLDENQNITLTILNKTMSFLEKNNLESALEFFQFSKNQFDIQQYEVEDFLASTNPSLKRCLHENPVHLELPPPLTPLLLKAVKKTLIANKLSNSANWLELHSTYQTNLTRGLNFKLRVSSNVLEKITKIIKLNT